MVKTAQHQTVNKYKNNGYKTYIADEKMVKSHHTKRSRGADWVGLGKSAVRVGLEKSQTTYLRFGLGYIPKHTNQTHELLL